MSWRKYGRPADGSAGPPDGGVTATESQPSRPGESPPDAPVPVEVEGTDPLAQTQAELASAQNEMAQWRDRFLRKAAEFDNYRKRTEKEKAETAALARSAVILELLPILDACVRAQESFPAALENDALGRYREGVELLYKQLGNTLAKLGVAPIEALGERFDPNRHEALIREENPDYPENTVIEVLREGYLYKDRLLRPAQVKVAVHPRQQDS